MYMPLCWQVDVSMDTSSFVDDRTSVISRARCLVHVEDYDLRRCKGCGVPWKDLQFNKLVR